MPFTGSKRNWTGSRWQVVNPGSGAPRRKPPRGLSDAAVARMRPAGVPFSVQPKSFPSTTFGTNFCDAK